MSCIGVAFIKMSVQGSKTQIKSMWMELTKEIRENGHFFRQWYMRLMLSGGFRGRIQKVPEVGFMNKK